MNDPQNPTSPTTIQQQIIENAEARIATWPKWRRDSLRAQVATLGRSAKVMAEITTTRAPCLDVCRVCIQPDHCRSHEQCHYTKSWLINPDGSPRTDMKDHPR